MFYAFQLDGVFYARKFDVPVLINGSIRRVIGTIGVVYDRGRNKVTVSDRGVLIIPQLDKNDHNGYNLAVDTLIEKYEEEQE